MKDEYEYSDELQYANAEAHGGEPCIDTSFGLPIRGTYCSYGFSCEYKVEVMGLCSRFKKCCLEYVEG